MARFSTKGVGTKKAGYAGPEFGPFRCGSCVWFQFGKSVGLCNHPEVKQDPEIEKNDQGQAIVKQDGCCNKFRPTRKLDEVKFETVGL